MISADAEVLARQLLAVELPSRWLHVQAVAQRAAIFASVYDDDRQQLLVVASLLHDVGYASPARRTGFHALDGAVYLRQLGIDERVVGLVANHSCAGIEAGFHHLDRRLACEFPWDGALPHDALLYCDLTTGPDGQALTLDQRLADIRARYGPEHLVSRFIDRAETEIRAAVMRMERLLELVPLLV